jgi:hypothetical protein
VLLAFAGHDPEGASIDARAGALVVGEVLLLIRGAIRGWAKGAARKKR